MQLNEVATEQKVKDIISCLTNVVIFPLTVILKV